METTTKIYETNLAGVQIYLNRSDVADWMTHLFNWLFGTVAVYKERAAFEKKQLELQDQLHSFLLQLNNEANESRRLTASFFEKLPQIHESLLEDLDTVLEFDPAAQSKSEVLLSYPGFFAITTYRIARALWQDEILVLPRLIAENAHSKTGIDIHPGAKIGKRFFIDHGTGIVIGETAQIGNDVKIYQGVTLGALSVSRDQISDKRHPTIEDEVIIYANASILGGQTVIGRGSVIGGNVWITHSIPPQSLVYHKSEIIVKNKQPFPDALNFSI